MPSMTVPSAAMRRLRRELDAGRMRASLAPARAITKKPSLPPLCPAPTASPAPGHARPSPFVVSGPCHAENENSSMICFRKGAHVRVRTPVGTLCTGQRLMLWLSAVVVSAAEEEDGYLGVVYTHYKHRHTDPSSGAVCVPTKDVKNLLLPEAATATATAASDGSSTVTTTISHSASPPPPQGDQATAVPVRRPTTAGKRPSLLKKMEKEMRSKSDAILASWQLAVYRDCDIAITGHLI